jgi:hypothetical protein
MAAKFLKGVTLIVMITTDPAVTFLPSAKPA